MTIIKNLFPLATYSIRKIESIMDDPQLNNENGFNPSGGRGRGRGRGVPLLPQG
jgi:hypothetical protein